MTPCPLCGKESFGIMLGAPDLVAGHYIASVGCGSCAAYFGQVVEPEGPHGVGSFARQAWEAACAAYKRPI